MLKGIKQVPNADRFSLLDANLQSSVLPCSLFIPRERDRAKHLGKAEALRLPPVEDCLYDIRRQAGERQEPADEGDRHPLAPAMSSRSAARPSSSRESRSGAIPTGWYGAWMFGRRERLGPQEGLFRPSRTNPAMAATTPIAKSIQ
jgi:hypothetical protein